MEVTKKQFFKYTLLPGIFPRIKNFAGSGFSKLAYLTALIYNMVRILPDTHPYLKSDKIGTYSIRQVIVEAANHIEFSKKNIDQIIIFFSIITGFIILFFQFVLLMAAILVSQAHASGVTMPTTIPGFFSTPNPKEDLAFRLLDLVFGVPDFFESKEAVNTSLHQALHALFQFYSFGMILVGSIIIIYFIIAVAAETATSGTPFGQRFNKAWATIRVILFFALLIPIANGLNAAQYITLGSAKLGSGLASTGWTTFNQALISGTETLTGEKNQNIATPKPANLSHIPGFMLIAKTCQWAYHLNYDPATFPASWDPYGSDTGIQAWAVYMDKSTAKYVATLLSGTTFQDLAAKSGSPDIYVVFGVKDSVAYAGQKASIGPVCGSVALKITDVSQPGSAVIHSFYFDTINQMWQGGFQMDKFAENYTRRYLNIAGYTDPTAALPGENEKKNWIEKLEKQSEKNIKDAVQEQITNGNWEMSKQMRDYGWAGSGIWYNMIAQQNGALIAAVEQTPMTIQYPEIMERNKDRKQKEDREPNWSDRFSLDRTKNSPYPYIQIPDEINIANTLDQVYKFWEGNDDPIEFHMTGNPIIDTINVVLGTQGLFEMCENTDIHPLAQLSAVGKSMVDSSIRSFAAAGIFTIGSIIPNPFSGAAEAFASFFGTIASVGLLVGFILFYVLPFMPFLYFFFAVGGWVKGIFEAMVAMPLWALAHLRIDGDGIPGEAAIGGYYLIFEIFIRPILIVFGLLAAILIFAGMVRVLNDIFYLVVTNLSGHDPESSTSCFKKPSQYSTTTPAVKQAELSQAFRGPVDEFFFTIVYTIIVYMIGTSCFKLIDMIPNNILRWINAEVPSFNDNADDAAEGLMKYVTLGGSQFGSQLGDSIGGLGKGIKGSVESFVKK